MERVSWVFGIQAAWAPQARRAYGPVIVEQDRQVLKTRWQTKMHKLPAERQDRFETRVA
jgi:hypothetical protein